MRISDWSSDVCSSDLRDIHAQGRTRVFLQLLRGTHHQVGLRRYAGHVVQAADRAVVTTTQADLVAPVEQPESRMQIVVTIRPPTGASQEPVQLCRRRPRSEARRVGKKCVRTCRHLWSLYPKKNTSSSP